MEQGRPSRRGSPKRGSIPPASSSRSTASGADGASLAGFCWTKVHEAEGDDPRLGEIYVIGVDPDHQGTGLGRALTVGGLEYLARVRDCPTGMLYVDGANRAALGVYRALGFQVHRADRAYELAVAP